MGVYDVVVVLRGMLGYVPVTVYRDVDCCSGCVSSEFQNKGRPEVCLCRFVAKRAIVTVHCWIMKIAPTGSLYPRTCARGCVAGLGWCGWSCHGDCLFFTLDSVSPLSFLLVL